ncbi:hypothetical protein SAMN05216223_11573 [Actinacidiphila yanglinensis]|uniref:Uncharacterized protein n=1 Tax=Actinacidiphila yanglinensis TaxID=310779 RepID=A0A1H6DIC2_9ACTN|nr:hypothetical protein [Actinacidiphila yanglinensis]SEG84425.1 hypothetical protein SAMN05216223_11573 [Actinacidiphila yanglinensis]
MKILTVSIFAALALVLLGSLAVVSGHGPNTAAGGRGSQQSATAPLASPSGDTLGWG